jgi:hypothetical protein
MDKNKIRSNYIELMLSFNLLEKKEEKRLVIISLARFFTFILGLVITWKIFTLNALPGIFAGLIFVTLFLYLLKAFSNHSERKMFFGHLARINKNESEALSGNQSAFGTGEIYIDRRHDYSYDIDLFGNSSLFQYLNRTVTEYGSDILAKWLSDPLTLSANILQRQQAVRELAKKDKWRQEFLASGMTTFLGGRQISELVAWLQEQTQTGPSKFKKAALYILPGATLLSLLLVATGFLQYQAFIFLFLVNLFYIASGLKETNRIHSALSKKYEFLSSFNGLLLAFEKEPFESPILNNIKQSISGDTTSAAKSVRKLGSLIKAFDNRINVIVGFLLNGLLLWDFQCVNRLEKWKSANRDLFPLWLELIGEADAFVSLGNYEFNNPDFAYPSLSVNGSVFFARNLGHQLIDEEKRVCNDFLLGKKGTVCIISGANMSGKSTFLRTVAVNYILAMAGAPVCATEMEFLPGLLFTSMRTTDSLSEHESYFYAELRRLNLVKTKIEAGDPVFFILDEILKGTNSADKSTGSKLFLQRIIERGGTGLLATHDTSLGEMENEYPWAIINKCFEIEIVGDNISFDYRIHDGITKKMNAVFLMKQMGILD